MGNSLCSFVDGPSPIIERLSPKRFRQQRPASTKSGLESAMIPRCSSSRARRPSGPHSRLTPTLGLSSIRVELPGIFASDDDIVVESM